jgi:hypothetical protein
MKILFFVILAQICICLANGTVLEKVGKIHKNFENVKNFCHKKHSHLCSDIQLKMWSQVLITELGNKLKEQQEAEKKRLAGIRKQNSVRYALAVNFLDRHL